MKKTLFITAISALTAGLLLAGCVPSEGKPQEPEVEIRPAPIEETEIRIAESFPPQIFAYVKAGLPDGCTSPDTEVVKKDGENISISVTVQRTKDAMCTMIYGTYERNIALGSDFTSNTTYTVRVNDAPPVTFTFP